MTVLATKIQNKWILLMNLVIGIVIMTAAVIVLPIAVFSIDLSLLTNFAVWCFVIVLMLSFALPGYFCYVRPFFMFFKLPQVQAETDGTYLYLHGRKEAKIPLADMRDAFVDAHIPYLMSKEFLVHMFSDQYGSIAIHVPKHGKFKLQFISKAQQAALDIIALTQNNSAIGERQ